MHARDLFPLLAAGLFVGVAPSAVAKPGAKKPAASKRATTKRPRRARGGNVTMNATGPGTPTPGLVYISLGEADFIPRNFSDLNTWHSAITGLRLPQGARIRELACFGNWKPEDNEHYGVLLRRHEHATNKTETVATAPITGGGGLRRIEGTADHPVDNFLNSYQVEMMVKKTALLHSCRVGYLPT